MEVMIITYQGLESFKVSQGDLVLALNPVSKDSKLKSRSFGADVTVVSLNHPDMNGVEQTTRGEKVPFVISGPGEYEIKDIFIKGFLSESRYGGERRVNTIYLITFEGMKLCFLGALSDSNLSSETLEYFENIDILFVPIGGGEVLDFVSAYKLAVSLEPAVIVPMHYESASLKQFLKEGGGNGEPLEKLVIKKKDLEGKKAEIIVLKEEQ